MSNVVKKNKDGYGYRYTDISEIHRYLEQNNLSYYQYIETNEVNGQDYIYTVPQTIQEDGEIIELPARRGCRVVDATLSGIKNPAQEQGSALTYARRYSLLMAFGLATDDDDAQSLSRPIISNKQEAEEYVINFGKYTGKKMKELPETYLTWLFENTKDETIKICCDYLMEHLTNDQAKERMALLNELNDIMLEKNVDRAKLYKHYKVSSDMELTTEQLRNAIERLNK